MYIQRAFLQARNDTQGWVALEGHIVPRSFQPEYVVLSVLISYIGAATTLELIHRRTAGRGSWNLLLLALSSISMGGIAVWSMHFIGNRAVIIGKGEIEIQIVYSPGYTALSFFLPVLVLFIAFGAVGANEELSRTRISLGGTLAGLGVSGVYYLGQAGIKNYDCLYNVGTVVGGALLSVVVNVGSLYIFFYFRASWDTRWWKRALCGVVLALAVSGMNWIAAIGTQYRLRKLDPSLLDGVPASTTVAIVIMLSVTGCLVLLTFAGLAQRRIMKAAKRAQQIVLATVVFDYEGKILVTHEGLLPCRKVTSTWIESSPDDIFSTAHPAFAWMFRTSRNWKGVEYLFPEMRRHLHNAGLRSRIRGSKAEANLLDDQGTVIDDYPLIFRELFCLTAADLARDLNQPIDRIGVLYDEILNSGLEPKSTKKRGKKSMAATIASSKAEDLEREAISNGPNIGRGQLLFLVSRVDRREAEHLQGAGFRFAQSLFVVPIIASRLQVRHQILTRRLEIMRDYVSDPHILEPGIHIACFAIRAALQVGRQGFDVLARKDAKNQLPTMQVPLESMEEWQLEYIKKMDSMTVASCMKYLFTNTKPKFSGPDEMKFAKLLLTTLEALKEEIDDPFFNDASFIATPIKAPCRAKDKDATPGNALLLAFRLVCPIHSRAPGKKLDFVSLTFFKMQQYVYPNSPNHAIFARKTYNDFTTKLGFELSVPEGKSFSDSMSKHPSSVFARGSNARQSQAKLMLTGMGGHFSSNKDGTDMFGNPIPKLQPKTPLKATKIRFWDRQSKNGARSENSSEKGLVDNDSQENRAVTPDPGLVASPKRRNSSGHSPKVPGSVAVIEMKKLKPEPPRGAAAAAAGKPSEDIEVTFVDELFKLTIQKRGF